MDPNELPEDFYGSDIATLSPLEEMGLWDEIKGIEEMPDELPPPFDIGIGIEDLEDYLDETAGLPGLISYPENYTGIRTQSTLGADSNATNIPLFTPPIMTGTTGHQSYENYLANGGAPLKEPITFSQNYAMDLGSSVPLISYFEVPKLTSVADSYRLRVHDLFYNFSQANVNTEFFDYARNSMAVLFAHPLGSTLRIEMKLKRALEGVGRQKEVLAYIYNRSLRVVEKLRAKSFDEKNTVKGYISEKDFVFVLLKHLSNLHKLIESMD
jgi:hypothetical protein